MATYPADNIVVELAPGGQPDSPTEWVWEDITKLAFEPVSIETGRRDEGAQVDPSKCTVTVDNTDGRFSPRNPLGPWFGQIGLNTPLRVRWGGRSEVTASTQSTVDTGTHVAPSVDSPTDNGLLVALWAAETNAAGGTYSVPGGMTAGAETGNEDGTLRSAWQAVGTGATGTRTATFTGATSSNHATGSFLLTGASGAPTVAQEVSGFIAEGETGTIIDIDATAAVTRGQTLLAIEVTSEVSEQNVFSEFDITSPNPGDYWHLIHDTGPGDFDVVPRIRAWTRPVTQDEPIGALLAQMPVPTLPTFFNMLKQWRILVIDGPGQARFTGFVSEWPTRWLGLPDNSRVPIVANGILRRLGQNDTPVVSPLYADALELGDTAGAEREICYWPLEIDRSSPVVGCPPLTDFTFLWIFGGSEGGVRATFAEGGPPGSAGQATLSDRQGLRSSLTGLDDDGFLVDGWVDLGDGGAAELVIIVHWREGSTGGEDPATITLSVRSDQMSFVFRPDGIVEPISPIVRTYSSPVAGVHHWAMQVTFNSILTVYLDGIQVSTSFALASDPGFPDLISAHWDANDEQSTGGLSHLNIGNAPSATDFPAVLAGRILAGTGYAGETAVARVQRVSAENGIPVATTGDPDNSVLMGPQVIAPFLEVLADVAITDAGLVHESGSRLAYRPGRGFMNQAVKLPLDWCDLRGTPEPTDDDQRIKNIINATSRTGDAIMVRDEASVAARGDYAESVSVNPATFAGLGDTAGWRLHLGTVDEDRWPLLSLELANDDALIPGWLSLRVGDRITVTHEFPQLTGVTIDLIVEGWTEHFRGYRWLIDFNCSPASPWNVGIVGDEILGRLDTDGSKLLNSVTASATTLDVDMDELTNPGILWTTDVAEFPFNVILGGEEMQVTAITGALPPQTFTVVRGVNGVTKPHAAGSSIRLARPIILAL